MTNIHERLDSFRDDTEQHLRVLCEGRVPNRRPTFAPPVKLDGDLLSICRELGYLTAEEKPVARLWAILGDPRQVIRSAPDSLGIRIRGFELIPGTTREPRLLPDAKAKRRVQIAEVRRRLTCVTEHWWTFGPRWTFHRDSERLILLKRIVELGIARITEFINAPQEQMEVGGVAAGICCCCGRPLTNVESIDRGIGPECGGRPRAIWSTARKISRIRRTPIQPEQRQ
jgi:hypothetical protein